MKSVGEVMAVGRTFEESIQKAIRMLSIGRDGLVLNRQNGQIFTEEEIEDNLSHHDDRILYHVAIALKMGISVERIYKLSSIDPWFIEKIKNIVDVESKLKESELDKSLLWEAKKLGFADNQIARAKDIAPEEIRKLRKELGVSVCQPLAVFHGFPKHFTHTSADWQRVQNTSSYICNQLKHVWPVTRYHPLASYYILSSRTVRWL